MKTSRWSGWSGWWGVSDWMCMAGQTKNGAAAPSGNTGAGDQPSWVSIVSALETSKPPCSTFSWVTTPSSTSIE